MMRELKQRCGYDREQVHWTNAVLCDVPKEEHAKARKACAARLRAEIAATGCKTVLAVGSLSLQSAAGLNRKPAIQRYRGAVIAPDDPLLTQPIDYTIIPTVHPAFVMRAEHWTPVFQTDVARAGRIAREGFVRPEHRPGVRIEVARTLEDVQRLLPQLDERVAIDIETTGLDIHTVKMTCLVLADTKLSVVIPWSKTQAGEGRHFNGHHDEVVAAINVCLSERVAETHNGPAYDHIGLTRFGINVQQWDDTLLGYHAITSHFPKRLGHVAACYMDVPPWKEWPHDVSLEELYQYCGRDGLYTAQSADKLFATFDEADWVVYEHDKRNAEMCRDMSVNGFAFDAERAASMSNELRLIEERLQREAGALVGRPDINLLSPKQMADAFFKDLGAHVCFRSESGAPSLAVDAMRAYAASANEDLAAMALKVLEYRRVRKCRRTYIEGVKPHADGRVRAVWLNYGTVSGRWSAQKPNLANLPRPENDPSMPFGGIRSLYVAPPGRALCAFDISQAEFRIAAYMTGDPNMIAACAPGQDVHSMNAATLFGEAFLRAEGDLRKTYRTLAKTSNFAICYMAEAPKVHARLVSFGIKITIQEVEALLRKLKASFAVYYSYQADSLLETMRRGYVESPIIGRKRWLGYAPEPPANANFPIQAGAADAMNIKLAKIVDEIKARRLDAKLVAMVYDAGYFDTAEGDADAVMRLFDEVFAEPITINGRSFVLPIDAHVGQRWSDL